MLASVLLGLGSNIGDRESYLEQAIEVLAAYDGVEMVAVSEFFNTEAVTSFEQPDYLNAACEIQTFLSPEELLKLTQDIETRFGRQAKGTGDPRTLDIDILMYGDEIISEDHLVIPHPLLTERNFVLKPLAEIAPNRVHPLTGMSVQDMLDDLE